MSVDLSCHLAEIVLPCTVGITNYTFCQKLENDKTDFHEIWYVGYAIKGSSKHEILKFLLSEIPT
jgi:hypothetical protein